MQPQSLLLIVIVMDNLNGMSQVGFRQLRLFYINVRQAQYSHANFILQSQKIHFDSFSRSIQTYLLVSYFDGFLAHECQARCIFFLMSTGRLVELWLDCGVSSRYSHSLKDKHLCSLYMPFLLFFLQHARACRRKWATSTAFFCVWNMTSSMSDVASKRATSSYDCIVVMLTAQTERTAERACAFSRSDKSARHLRIA